MIVRSESIKIKADILKVNHLTVITVSLPPSISPNDSVINYRVFVLSFTGQFIICPCTYHTILAILQIKSGAQPPSPIKGTVH